MSTIHPSWESTDGGQGSRPSRPAARPAAPARTAHVPIAVSRGSPRPAAVVGILLAIGVGFGISQNLWLFTGQLGAPREVSVTITKSGFRPVNSSAVPGQTIRWTNTDSVEHVIGSEKIQTQSGAFAPLILAPGAEGSITLSQDIPAGTYVYTAQDKSQFQGVIRVMRSATASSGAATSDASVSSEEGEFADEEQIAEDDDGNESSTPSFAELLNRRVRQVRADDEPEETDEDEEVATRRSAPDGGTIFTLGDSDADGDDAREVKFEDGVAGGTVERKPHTVGSAPPPPPPSYRPAAGASSAPEQPVTQTFVPQAEVAGETFRAGAPRPTRQPSSGPEMWILAGASLGLFLVFTRKALAAD